MSIKVLNELCTFVFCEVPCLYQTGRIWRQVGDEFALLLPAKRAIYDFPSDTVDIRLKASKSCSNMYVLRGITESGYHEPMTSATMPFESSSNDPEKDYLLLKELELPLLNLAEEFDVEIVVTRDQIYNLSTIAVQTSFYINLIGFESHVSTAYLHLWSMIKLYQGSNSDSSPTFIEYLDLDAPSLLPVAIAVELANIKNISCTYKTEVHIPSLMCPFKSDANLTENYRPQIFFSGKIHALVLAAKEAVLKTVQKYNSSLYCKRFSNISPQKLLFIRKHYQQELNRLMVKYQSFVRVTDKYVDFQSPCVALLESVTKVFTVNVLHQIVEIQVTLRENFIFSSDLQRSICVDDTYGPILVAYTPLNSNQLLIVGNHSEMVSDNFSNQSNLKRSGLLDCLAKILSTLPSDTLYQLKSIFEIHSDYEDFISGKKNGKITRIMESAPSLIKLERFAGDDAMFLSLIADSLNDFKEAFSMVVNELPAEDSFFIPEVYHRPVIGAGGSVIQATMKKYNVFVRFSNSFLLPQNELCHVRYDNVIIRCPYKNVSSICSAKRELNQLARDYGRIQPRVLIRLSPGQYRYTLSSASRGGQTIGNIEKKYNVYIMFPFVEPSDGYLLEIRGNDDTAFNAAKELVGSSFGAETEFHLNKEIPLNEDFYNSLVVPFKHTMNIEISVNGDLLRITYEEGNPLFNKALMVLSDWFKSKELKVVSRETVHEFIIRAQNAESKRSETPNSNPNSNSKRKSAPARGYRGQGYLSPLQSPDGIQYLQSWSSTQFYHSSFSENKNIMRPEQVQFSPKKYSNGWA